MKVLVTGAAGQLGTDVLHAFGRDDVVALSRDELDVADEPAVVDAVTQAQPDLVVHCAAFTKVDACESEPDTAWAVNAAGPWWVARACAIAKSALLYVSTDYVFDGTATRPYNEFDVTNPQSVYGRTKEAGEQLVRSTLDEHYIVRTSWVQGASGGNFVKTMLRLGAERDELSVVADQHGSPTFTFDLAPMLRSIAVSGRFGTYHVTNSGSCSWYELALAVFEGAGIDVRVTPTDTVSYGAPAPRPANSVLENRMTDLAGLPRLPSWQDSLGKLLEELGAA